MRFGERPPTAGLPPRFADLAVRGREDDRLEQAIARTTGAAGALLLSSGSACLVVAFEHLKKSSGRRTVIIPAYTCPLVVLAAEQAGLKVVACDMAPGRFDLDLEHLSRLIGSDTLCVVPTHYGGWLTDVAAVRAVTARRDPAIAIVEDAAQAFGATWDGRSVGLAGDIGVFSFAAGKGLTLFEGGALIAASADLMQALRATSRSVARPDPRDEALMTIMLAGYHLVYNPLGMRVAYGAPTRSALARGDDIAAARDHFEGPILVHPVGRWRRAVGLQAMPRLAAHLAAARGGFDRLAAAISTLVPACPGLVVHTPLPTARPSATFLMVTLPDTAKTAGIITRLWRARLGVSKLFTRAIADYPYLAGQLLASDTPNARHLAACTIIVSTAGRWHAQDVETVTQAIRECGR